MILTRSCQVGYCHPCQRFTRLDDNEVRNTCDFTDRSALNGTPGSQGEKARAMDYHEIADHFHTCRDCGVSVPCLATEQECERHSLFDGSCDVCLLMVTA